MYELILGFLMLAVAYKLKELLLQDFLTRLFQYALIGGGCLFILHAAYVYLILPDEIAKFTNAGAGLTYTAGGQNLTVFSSSDEAVLYYAAQVKQDWWIWGILLMAAWWVVPFLFAFWIIWWAWGHNLAGEWLRAGGKDGGGG